MPILDAQRPLRALVAIALIAAAPLAAQRHGGFIARLGADTMQVEEFTRNGNTTHGTILVHAPRFRRVQWSMTYDDRGTPLRFRAESFDADGAPMLASYTGTMTFRNDSLVRDVYNATSELVQVSSPAPYGAVPYTGIPYFGLSYLMYEDGFAAARRRIAAGVDSVPYLYQITLFPAQLKPQRSRAWLVAADSAELDYFGVARSGFKFNAAGELLRSDWTRTTYRYLVERVGKVDLETIATAWIAAERAGKGVGTISPRDSVKAVVGSSNLTFDYSRPAVRGRVIWGDIVPWDKVWRLGADMATHFTTSADLLIGGTTVPAGRYSLWLIPSETAPLLVVSSAVNVFGTSYNPARDFARIPVRRASIAAPVERLTIGVRDGVLVIAWDKTEWVVPVVVKP
ncbi:MAG: DUF2911 domain-containing protein [Gemmatimonadota bacterium]